MSFQLQSNIGQINSQIARKIRKAVQGTAGFIETHMKNAMQEEKHGRQYGKHVASAPGEAPATDTGLLVNSISYEMVSDTEARVGAAAEYAVILEFGSSHMAARPFMGPAFEDAKEPFEKALQNALK